MRITESKLRTIIAEEASRIIREASGSREELDSIYGMQPPEDFVGEGEGEEHEGGEGGEGMWFGGYDDSDLVYLDSGDDRLDDAWATWAGATKVLLSRAGSRRFKSESGDAPTVKEMMVEIIGYF